MKIINNICRPDPFPCGKVYGAASKVSGPRPFKEYLTTHEHDCLHFILKKLAESSFIKLAFLAKDLQRKGDEIRHLHPLTFFLGILADGRNKKYFHSLRHGGGKAWHEFYKGAENSFREESDCGNITPEQVDTFCKRTKLDFHTVVSLIEKKRWEQLINYF